MSWKTRLGKLALEFGEDVIKRVADMLPAEATEAEALDPGLLVAGAYGAGSQLNDDGSVTRPDGSVIDPVTVQNDLRNTAQSMSRYY